MQLVAGSGLFAGLLFYPLVPELLSDGFLVRDFTAGLEGLPELSSTGYTYDVGRYNERRRAMYTTDLFGGSNTDPWSEAESSTDRDIHIGVDVGGPVGTAVHSVADCVIHSVGYNAAAGDYGNVIVTEQTLNEQRVFALYGHLSAASIEGKRVGDKLTRGQLLGWLGDKHENGGWPAHVHFQLSLEEPETHDMPGVVSASQHAAALKTYPDPRMVLGPLYEGDGLFE